MMTNEDLIQLVYSKPEIWDQNSLHYTSKEMKAKAWSSIADRLNVSADAAKSRWTNLRDLFRRELKKTLKMARDTGDPEAYIPRWKHFRNMLFLKEQIVKDEEDLELPSLTFDETCNLYPQTILEDGETIKVEDESYEDEYSPSSTPSQLEMNILPETSSKRSAENDSHQSVERQFKKQRRDFRGHLGFKHEYHQTLSNGYGETDEDYHFVMSILPSIRRIRQDRKTPFKMKVLQLIMDEENCSEY